MLYLLPKVNLSSIDSTIVVRPIINSIQHYLNTFVFTNDVEDKIATISKYKPIEKYFFVMVELLIMNKININTEIQYLGSNACIEALNWIKECKICHTTTPSQLIICDVDSFKLQIEYCLNTQIVGGMCFLKLTDSYNTENIQLLYILCACYSNIYMYKPQSIKNTNLVKFIICNDFKKKINIDNYKNINIPVYFNTKINEINFTYGQMHIEHLQYNDESNEKWISWCSDFFIPI